MRTEWNVLTGAVQGGGSTSLIDNVIACNFTWTTTPDTVPLLNGNGDTVSYPMITQVGFAITVQETDTTSGTNQIITISKSYSNIQPRNIIAADVIYNLACNSAKNNGSTNCTAASSLTPFLNGELQPDPEITVAGTLQSFESTITW
jgi:hypothetical protein